MISFGDGSLEIDREINWFFMFFNQWLELSHGTLYSADTRNIKDEPII